MFRNGRCVAAIALSPRERDALQQALPAPHNLHPLGAFRRALQSGGLARDNGPVARRGRRR
ncbi:hypothetical protein I2I05_11735 [Hymenobacter sp. BT683]|uniref:Uncharacterized protein n=1 Tax=Hymenobacter jeongseonensis TaxID=2791027 RepID=A0ABS0IIA4_9BACT|nr:hypothetical protein [Hymenobacter jeongseonensis]MBF9238066.1 hypothetical protein [Hymenobacter jeongseonensis]